MGAVGHTLESAERTGIAAVAVDHSTGGSAGSTFYGRKAPGTTRLVFDADRDVLVGATFVGPDVAEMLHAATIAIVGETPAATLAHAIPAFPTRSEIWLRLLAKYEQAEHPQKLRRRQLTIRNRYESARVAISARRPAMAPPVPRICPQDYERVLRWPQASTERLLKPFSACSDRCLSSRGPPDQGGALLG
jgi:hypothetical protein